MKFFPEAKKKTLLLGVVLLLCLAGILYFNFFLNAAAPPKVPAEQVSQALAQGRSSGSSPQSVVIPTKPMGGLLPYGSSIDLGILQDQRFRALKSAPPLQVLPEELGRPNLFGD